MDGGTPTAEATSGRASRRDVAILKFLAAAELIETDLWQQYAELALDNPGFSEALEQIDDDLGIYTVDITEDELSHARFINAFLKSLGEQPVSLAQFETLMPPSVTGLRQVGRLTNLTRLTVDTSYYLRYRSTRNPDFGFEPPQIATINGRPAIPTSNSLSDRQLSGIAQTAAFHFPSIEQGGTSLYDQFVPFVSDRQVLRIVSSIYATEAIHYAIFRDSLTGVPGFDSGDGKLMIPNLTEGRRQSSYGAQTALLTLREMEAALARLPDDQREVLVMVALSGMSYQDCAAVLGMPVGTVMSRLARGREFLRQVLEGNMAAGAEPLLRRVK